MQDNIIHLVDSFAIRFEVDNGVKNWDTISKRCKQYTGMGLL